MNLDVYNTHMELYPYVKDQIPAIEDMYTATDKFTGIDKPCGYMVEDGKLFLPRGTQVAKIERICNLNANYINESDPFDDMDDRHSPAFEPNTELQQQSVNFLKEDKRQLALNLKTGMGKTFCVAFASTELRQRTIIITPDEGIKQQWINTYKKMCGYRDKSLLNIAGSSVIELLMSDSIDKADVYFVNHATLRNYTIEHGGYMLHQFFKKIAVGIKVYDESHMDFNNIILIDFFSNTNRTWYITATFDRSDKTQSACFKRAFNSVETFGEMESEEIAVKHVIYHKVIINSMISPKDRAAIYSYQGMSSTSYGKYAFFVDKNNTAYQAILRCLKIVEKVEGKILIFVPLIDAVDEVVKRLKKDQNKSVGAYHSKISRDEKEASLTKKDIIVSTIKSCGTGQDIKGLRCVISLEPFASKIIAKQTFGRIRPYKNKDGEILDTYYFDCVDCCIPAINWWFNARFKVFGSIAKKVVYLNVDD